MKESDFNQVQSTENARPIWMFLVIGLIFLVITIYSSLKTSRSKSIDHQKVEKIISGYDVKVRNSISNLFNEKNEDSFPNDLNITEYLYRGVELFLYKKDTLIKWTNNSINIEEPIASIQNKKLVHLNNGYYYAIKSSSDEYTAVALLLIKYEYPYRNLFLSDEFNPVLNIPQGYNISQESGDIIINGIDDQFLFALTLIGEPTPNNLFLNLTIISFHTFLIVLLVFLYILYFKYQKLIKRKNIIPYLYSLDVVLILIILNYFKIPRVMYDSGIYQLYPSGVFSLMSVGSFLTNSIIALSISYAFYDSIRLHNYKFSNKLSGFLLFNIRVILLVTFFIFITNIISALLQVSVQAQDFNFRTIFYNTEIISVFIVISVLLFAFFIISFVLFENLKNRLKTNINKLIFSGTLITTIVISYLVCDCLSLFGIIFLALFIATFIVNRGDKFKLSTLRIIFYLILFSAFISTIAYQKIQIFDRESKVGLAKRLAIEKDVIAESEFVEIYTKIQNDSVLNKDEFYNVQSIRDQNRLLDYFNIGSWGKYKKYITICDENKILDIVYEGYEINCTDYFKSIIEEVGIPTAHSALYQIPNETENLSYIAVIELSIKRDDNNIPVYIYVELNTEFIPEGLGYPELLLDETEEIFNTGLTQFSYAKYRNDELIYKFGNYYYSLELSILDKDSLNGKFVYENGYSHYHYKVDANTYIIVSKKADAFWDIFAPFSYFFILLSLFLIVFFLLTNFSFTIIREPLSFKNRLQFAIMSIVLVSFLVIGLITVTNIIRMNEAKNNEILREKTHSVLVEFNHKLGNEESLESDIQDFLTEILEKFSHVFFSDINLYNLDGELIASSRSQIFTEGLISSHINPNAYDELQNGKKLLYIHDEAIGNYKYLSAYIPFRNSNNKLIAYLNLPYFARQTELQQEISTFLVALINIYVIIFVLALLFAILISNQISKPIQLIKSNLRQIQLGGINEKIPYTAKDEIGNLVAEYNRMIDELSKSVELLAISERESAWREMAKQVAHEIKNPLTPMKLSVQYLKKAWDDKTEDWDERLDRFTSTIIEQIDTLSGIAGEFSDFAKMPVKKEGSIDLNSVLKNSIDLFSETKNLNIEFSTNITNAVIDADKNQILRVFNNLIKNSIQAIDNNNGLIKIELIKEITNSYLITISDNGPGIPNEMKDKIFKPSFTTKSSGMGLGLAIVRSIVIEAGGEIWFESKVGEGTQFYIRFNKL